MPASKATAETDPMLEVLRKGSRPEPVCRVCLWLATAPPLRAIAIRAALADPDMGINTIRRALEAGGVMTVKNHSLTRHRKERHG